LCHTKFSAFDGLNTAKDFVDFSVNSKMEGIGFCDRNNVQGFPNIDSATAKKQFPMYGYEVSVINKKINFCINCENNNGLIDDQEYVVFDIETTGLINEIDEIIEFGAIKAKNGIIIDKIDLLLKPNKPLPQHITDLTHITNQMLSNKNTFEQEAQNIVN
jgi:DNA polymerase-3 subunit alpha (Gram-positive type)